MLEAWMVSSLMPSGTGGSCVEGRKGQEGGGAQRDRGGRVVARWASMAKAWVRQYRDSREAGMLRVEDLGAR
jgi:hypothetical protein